MKLPTALILFLPMTFHKVMFGRFMEFRVLGFDFNTDKDSCEVLSSIF